jgi:hypothetical protein
VSLDAVLKNMDAACALLGASNPVPVQCSCISRGAGAAGMLLQAAAAATAAPHTHTCLGIMPQTHSTPCIWQGRRRQHTQCARAVRLQHAHTRQSDVSAHVATAVVSHTTLSQSRALPHSTQHNPAPAACSPRCCSRVAPNDAPQVMLLAAAGCCWLLLAAALPAHPTAAAAAAQAPPIRCAQTRAWLLRWWRQCLPRCAPAP